MVIEERAVRQIARINPYLPGIGGVVEITKDSVRSIGSGTSRRLLWIQTADCQQRRTSRQRTARTAPIHDT